MDKIERIRTLRDEYEAALDEAERLRDQYHREIVKLHRSGMSLRDIAERLGISHQRVHQIVSPHEAESSRRSRRVGLAGAGAIVVLVTAGVVWFARPQTAQFSQPPAASPQQPNTRVPSIVRPVDGTVIVVDPETGEVLAMISGRQHRAIEEYLANVYRPAANASNEIKHFPLVLSATPAKLDPLVLATAVASAGRMLGGVPVVDEPLSERLDT